jgi:hypothetical protein
MGRGRAKAKQTKVARELKYSSPNTDLSKLQAELAHADTTSSLAQAVVVESDDDEEEDDPYAKYYVDEDDEDDTASA